MKLSIVFCFLLIISCEKRNVLLTIGSRDENPEKILSQINHDRKKSLEILIAEVDVIETSPFLDRDLFEANSSNYRRNHIFKSLLLGKEILRNSDAYYSVEFTGSMDFYSNGTYFSFEQRYGKIWPSAQKGQLKVISNLKDLNLSRIKFKTNRFKSLDEVYMGGLLM